MSLIVFSPKTKIKASEVNSNFTDVKQITIRNEDLSPLCNGILTIFPTAFVFQPNSLAVYWRDNVALAKTERLIKGTDYNENVGYQGFTIISANIPATGDNLIVDYTKDI